MRSAEEKEIFQESKTRIVNEVKLELGLVVDIPKPGVGTTNDGNTASRFFERCQISSHITGINQEVTGRFNVVLSTISQRYQWYPMRSRRILLNH